MRKYYFTLLCWGIAFFCHAQPASSSGRIKLSDASFDVTYAAIDSSTVRDLLPVFRESVQVVSHYFGKPFLHRFTIDLFATRQEMDKQWQQEWGDTSIHSECWMVAAGMGDKLQMLSPRVWNHEACEHQASDKKELQQVIAHELVHVYHGQINPNHDFTGLDSLAWFIEGLATYVSGQVDEKRIMQVKKVIALGEAPQQLNRFWTGAARYGLAGTLVQYISDTYGREKAVALLPQTDQKVMLQMLGTTEHTLITDWKKSLQ
jgi:hypothetical protein